jgi:hypothetical protein
MRVGDSVEQEKLRAWTGCVGGGGERRRGGKEAVLRVWRRRGACVARAQ